MPVTVGVPLDIDSVVGLDMITNLIQSLFGERIELTVLAVDGFDAITIGGQIVFASVRKQGFVRGASSTIPCSLREAQ